MKIAILLGVSKYDNISDLAGCEHDITAVHSMLQAGKSYDLIECIDQNATGLETKKHLTSLFSKLENEPVEELFFYFTGHGLYHQDDFYYLLSDFDDGKKRQTSLQNSEIDNLIRTIKPELVIKVIDACQSGVSYIKGEDKRLETYYKATTSGFKKCYFFHSSMTNQYSYQNKDLSDFTKSFIESVFRCEKQEIRYKDIIDYISDYFEDVTQQTPFFVTQAAFTEHFITCSALVKSSISRFLPLFEKEQSPSKEPSTKEEESLLEKVRKDAEQYATEEEVKQLLNSIKEKIQSKDLSTELSDLYDVSFYTAGLAELPNGIKIGNWLSENTNDFFAAPTYDEVSYEEEVGSSRIAISIADMMRPKRTVTKYRKVLKGFELSVDVPYKSLYYSLKPAYPNLPYYVFILTFMMSKREIKFFYTTTNYQEKNWKDRDINKNFNWNSVVFKIKDNESVIQFVNSSIEEFNKFVLETIVKNF